jgi:hypothetical protein
MYARGNASRPSLPGQSTSTSTTSLYHPEYAAPPSAYPHHMSTDPSVLPTQGTGLTKTPSPLSHPVGPTSVDEMPPSNASDVGLQMRSRSAQAPSAAATPSANTLLDQTASSNPVQGHSSVAAPTELSSNVANEPQQPKRSKKDLAKEAKDAKEKRKAEEKSKAVEAARQKAEAVREKRKREDDAKARKEAEKVAAKLMAKQDKAQAKLRKSADVAKPKTSALVMPATPLKGRTTDLSAATPVSIPGTPVTPAEPVHLIDMAPSESQLANASNKPSPLSEEPLTTAVQEPNVLLDAKPIASIARTPLKSGPDASRDNNQKQSPALQSVKPKMSLFGTLRRKFGSSSAPAASVRSGSKPRGLATTPESRPSASASASVRSAAQPDQSSPDLSKSTIPDNIPRVENLTSATSELVTPEPVETIFTQSTSTDSSTSVTAVSPPNLSSAEADAAFQDGNMVTTQTMASEPLKDSAAGDSSDRDEGGRQSKRVIDQMIARAREGGLNVDLHVRYIQDLDTVSR